MRDTASEAKANLNVTFSEGLLHMLANHRELTDNSTVQTQGVV